VSAQSTRVRCVCRHCGAVFFATPYRVQAGRGKHCSQRCYWDALPGRALPLIDRFFKYVGKKQPSGCVLWKGFRDASGYGALNGGPGNKRLWAHRVAYELFVGPIPDGLQVLHSCDVRACINPTHMTVGTNADNTTDKVAKGRQRRGERTPGVKLTTAKVLTIRARHAAGATRDQLALDCGVTPGQIGRIVRRVDWKHV
jgi:hypothetical protein